MTIMLSFFDEIVTVLQLQEYHIILAIYYYLGMKYLKNYKKVHDYFMLVFFEFVTLLQHPHERTKATSV